MARSDALSAVQPFVDSVIKSLVSEYEDKLSSKQEYLDRLVREAQDARELNEALSSQCVPAVAFTPPPRVRRMVPMPPTGFRIRLRGLRHAPGLSHQRGVLFAMFPAGIH
jgi:hypothetical protein